MVPWLNIMVGSSLRFASEISLTASHEDER